jgi:hypothetical protein
MIVGEKCGTGDTFSSNDQELHDHEPVTLVQVVRW